MVKRLGGQYGKKYDKAPETLSPARITAPASGTIIALDPDIPPRNQRLRLSAGGQDLRWLIDRKPFAKGASALWLPWPGKHLIQIANASGKVLDEVHLEVGGAGVR